MNYDKARNDVTPQEALDAFKKNIEWEKQGIDPRSESKDGEGYRKNSETIHKFIGCFNEVKNCWSSTLGEYMQFTEWAYTKLGYVYGKKEGVQRWYKEEDVGV